MFDLLSPTDSTKATAVAYEAGRMLMLGRKARNRPAPQDTVEHARALITEIEAQGTRLASLSDAAADDYRAALGRVLYSRIEAAGGGSRAHVLANWSQVPMQAFVLNPFCLRILRFVISQPGTATTVVRQRLATSLFGDQAYPPALLALRALTFVEERTAQLYPTQRGRRYRSVLRREG